MMPANHPPVGICSLASWAASPNNGGTTMIVTDHFCGAGGFSDGAERAGCEVVWAANHNPKAIELHTANHPTTHHECQDLHQFDFHAMPDCDLMLAAPACQGHSQASQPKRRAKHDADRATAWAVVAAAEAKAPPVILVENLLDFERWSLYGVWTRALAVLGYSVRSYRLRASDFGVPQDRTRLFVVCSRTRAPLQLTFNKLERPGFGPHIRWDQGTWKSVDSATPRVRERISWGRERHGARFITQHVTGHKGRSLAQPLPTVTRADQLAVVDGDRYRPLDLVEYRRAMGFRDDWIIPASMTRCEAVSGFGNAVCPPVAQALIEAVKSAA